MAIEYVKRLAGPYVGEGQSTFTFGFLIFKETDVYVGTAFSNDEASTILEYGTDYKVTMNGDQDATPGGSITLTTPLLAGQVVVVGSNIAYTQELQLTNYTRFPPEQINMALDRIVIQIQQIVEMTGRVLSVPPTSNETPDQMIDRLFKAQKEAQQYAKQAEESYQNAKGVEDRLTGQEATLLEELRAEGKKQVGNVKAEGDVQAERLKTAVDQTLVGYGIAGVEQTWTVANDTPSGSTITLPLGMSYVVGHHHLRLVWNGLVLVKDDNFSEIGVADSIATTFKINFDLKQGDQLNAWAIPLGRGDSTNVLERVATVEQSMADLSRTVAYREGAK